MEEEQVQEQSTSLETALNEIDNLKQNSVSKEDYNKLKEENDLLVKRMANERPVVVEQKPIEPTEEDRFKKLKENANEISKGNLTGYEYAKLLVENDDIMNELGIDTYGTGDEDSQRKRTRNDTTVKVLKESLEECKGDAKLFNNILESKLIDR